MGQQYRTYKVAELFAVNSGDFHALSELDAGDVPLISCGDLNNGLVGYFDIPEKKRYDHAITVAYNGSPLTTKFHPYPFGAKDDVAVLTPLKPMGECAVMYVAALLNRMTWRYSYGRKCFKEKLGSVELRLPVSEKEGDESIDERVPSRLLRSASKALRSGASAAIEQILPTEGDHA